MKTPCMAKFYCFLRSKHYSFCWNKKLITMVKRLLINRWFLNFLSNSMHTYHMSSSAPFIHWYFLSQTPSPWIHWPFPQSNSSSSHLCLFIGPSMQSFSGSFMHSFCKCSLDLPSQLLVTSSVQLLINDAIFDWN